MLKKINYFILISLLTVSGCSEIRKKGETEEQGNLEKDFTHPPDSARPWVFWFWINGNITREGITADLEAMKRVGVGGVLWMEVAGPWWAPEGQVSPYTPQWDDHMQWAIREAERLGLDFTITVDFGYGSGGPHIKPDNSMQELCWSREVINGGKKAETVLKKPVIHYENIEKAWVRPDQKLNRKVLEDIKQIDSYRDIAVFAIPFSPGRTSYAIPQLNIRTALGAKTYFRNVESLSPPVNAIIPGDHIIDLTKQMDADGTLKWEAPPGKWEIFRLGHASNFKITRPCPVNAMGLECDRLSPEGIDAHFEAFLKPVFENAGTMAGNTLKFVHVDSWEAGCQNWTASFPSEFLKRRGYDMNPWLPVLTGTVVESPELSERFLWDFRHTVSELTIDNYALRLRELAKPYGIRFSTEAYGNLCIDNLKYAESSDFQICEFWAIGTGLFPKFGNQHYYNTMKVMASAAHATGQPRVGAEAFTSGRGWHDHPYLYKAMGDEAFCRGVNHFILHLSAHQAYEQMKPGLTHRRWGGHFNRHNTWWEYSKPWFDYLARCQYMLQQGTFVADVCYFFGEGATLHVADMNLSLPPGYDYDVCSADMIQEMKVMDGKITLPSGMSYRYLLLPETGRLTLESARKIKELAESGAQIIAREHITGTPGLSGYPDADREVKQIADNLWDKGKIITGTDWENIFRKDQVNPDFQGEGLLFIHRKTDNCDLYFVSNPDPETRKVKCSFRISGKIPEIWDPENGVISELPDYETSNGCISITLPFEPMQSWFVVFRKKKSDGSLARKVFSEYIPVKDITGPWQVSFLPEWGGPENPVIFDTLTDWSKHSKEGIRYYSGTAVYKKTFRMEDADIHQSTELLLDLGKTEVIAAVKLNGKNCGIAWKPPYQLDITDVVRAGNNDLEIEVVNTWVNRLTGDEQLPDDYGWVEWEVLRHWPKELQEGLKVYKEGIREVMEDWPEWFMKENGRRPTERYTFTTATHYQKNDPLMPSGLLGPVRILKEDRRQKTEVRRQKSEDRR